MRNPRFPSLRLLPLSLLASLPVRVLAGDVLQTNGFSTCVSNPTIKVQQMNVQFDRSTDLVNFTVAGSSDAVQNVTASLQIWAYGHQVYTNSFDPCNKSTFVKELCPVPAGSFAASGSQKIPQDYASKIPSIAFSIPNLDGTAKLELKSPSGGQDLACIEATVSNGKTMNIPAVSYIAMGIAGASLLVSGISALASAGQTGNPTSSPSFFETVHWFQSMAMNGMLDVAYPPIYRSFTQNFGFSTGLFRWDALQTAIDGFRAKTGGNLTDNSLPYLQSANIVWASDVANVTRRDLVARAGEGFLLAARQVTTSVNGTASTHGGNGPAANKTSSAKPNDFVSGIQGYVNQLSIPQANTFMTVLLVFAIVIAAIAAGILLFKVILEAWALWGTFPKRLTTFRKRYWWLVAKTITNLIFLFYGVWTLYCIYQFTAGDSWAAKALAGVTLGCFTAILIGFTLKIWHKAQQYKKLEGDASGLFDDKDTWYKYSIFYDSYKRSYWWLFVPVIIYMFAKGCIIAGGQGHGLVQSGGQLIVDAVFLVVLLWARPYTLASGNWINIVIQVVRVLSVACILVFVEELGVGQTTKTITGLVLIVTQAILTTVLAILIAVNTLIIWCRTNPHRKARKELEKSRNGDQSAGLDARNSLLMRPLDPIGAKAFDGKPAPYTHVRGRSGGYESVSSRGDSPSFRDSSRVRLTDSAAGPGGRRASSPMSYNREPRLPDIGYRGGGGIGQAM